MKYEMSTFYWQSKEFHGNTKAFLKCLVFLKYNCVRRAASSNNQTQWNLECAHRPEVEERMCLACLHDTQNSFSFLETQAFYQMNHRALFPLLISHYKNKKKMLKYEMVDMDHHHFLKKYTKPKVRLKIHIQEYLCNIF